MPPLISALAIYTVVSAPVGQIAKDANFQLHPNLLIGKDNMKWKTKWPYPIDITYK